MNRVRIWSLVAGVLYLVTHVSSVAAAVVYRTDGDHLRLAIALEVVLALACAANGAVLAAAFWQHARAGAGTVAVLRTVEAATILAGTLPVLALAMMQDTGAVPDATRSTLMAVHESAFLVGQGLVIAVNTLVIASILWRSRLVYRGIAVLGIVGGALVLVSDIGQLFGTIAEAGAVAAVLAAPVFAFETWFAWYLIVVGFREKPSTVGS